MCLIITKRIEYFEMIMQLKLPLIIFVAGGLAGAAPKNDVRSNAFANLTRILLENLQRENCVNLKPLKNEFSCNYAVNFHEAQYKMAKFEFYADFDEHCTRYFVKPVHDQDHIIKTSQYISELQRLIKIKYLRDDKIQVSNIQHPIQFARIFSYLGNRKLVVLSDERGYLAGIDISVESR